MKVKKLKNYCVLEDFGTRQNIGNQVVAGVHLKISVRDEAGGESFWTIVKEVKGIDYIVAVNNELLDTKLHGLKLGDVIAVRDNNILELQPVGVQVICPEFDFDNLDIIGVVDGKVHLMGSVNKFDLSNPLPSLPDDPMLNPLPEQPKCIIILSRALFHKTLDMWLSDKENFCSRSAGTADAAMGTLMGTGFVELPAKDRVTLHKWIGPKKESDKDWYTYECFTHTPMRTFVVTSFDKYVGMEHG